MTKLFSTAIQKLSAKLPIERIPFKTSEEIPKNGQRRSAHSRALKALELSLHIKDSGYNIYLSGEANSGRSYLVNEFLSPKAKNLATPPDLIYVNNFDDQDKPVLIALSAGQGLKFQKTLQEMLLKARKEIVAQLEKEPFEKKRNALYEAFQAKRNKFVHQMELIAEKQGFNIDLDEQNGMTLFPLIEGKRLNPQDFDGLDFIIRKDIRNRGANLTKSFNSIMREISKLEQNFIENEKKLERDQASGLLNEKFKALKEKFIPFAVLNTEQQEVKNFNKKILDNSKKLSIYLDALQKDLLENLEPFLSRELNPNALPPQGMPPQGMPPFMLPESADQLEPRYEVNLFVNNSGVQGAPVINDEHPTVSNLLGCIERESEMGALITDFSLIKAGSLHRANGGFLVLHLTDLVQHSAAYEGLLRALRSSLARIEDQGEGQETNKTKGLEPEPLRLALKVILIGSEEMYEHLLMHDDRLKKLFKIKAHLNADTERNAAGVRIYLSAIRKIIDEAKLLHFDKEALAGLVDIGSRLREDQKKLSLKFPLLREVMIEASALASMQGKELVDSKCLEETIAERKYRIGLYEEAYLEEYERKVIKVMTSGEAIGQVNGLSVTTHGDCEFGLPHQISCTVGVGNGGIIDLEREADMSGPIHTKGMLIIKSYLLSMFARKKPIILSGSICFEQSYAGIEGDSASGAELAALISALASVPVKLSLAFTGAVSQSGQIMAVGGVTDKIEGFFEVCRRRGLTGEQGVILPYDNLDHLMLSTKVIDAVKNNLFHIYQVNHIDEAIELLTGIPAGKMRKDGTFSKGSVYKLVDQRLTELARIALKYQKNGRNRP